MLRHCRYNRNAEMSQKIPRPPIQVLRSLNCRLFLSDELFHSPPGPVSLRHLSMEHSTPCPAPGYMHSGICKQKLLRTDFYAPLPCFVKGLSYDYDANQKTSIAVKVSLCLLIIQTTFQP